MRVGFQGLLNALAMEPRRGSSRPRRAQASSCLQFRFKETGSDEAIYKGIVLCVVCTQGSCLLVRGTAKQVYNGASFFCALPRREETFFTKNGVICVIN